MGSGLSMTSVNKIKELANAKEYSLALDIVDTQDLTRSLNPQFLRLCAEIFVQNNRLGDARKSLVMARKLGPESRRIMFSCLDLYLRMGFFELAKTYYDMYMFEIDEFGIEANQGKYIWEKHEGKECKDLEEYLDPYAHNLDYDWSYELYLLYKQQGKDKEAKNLADLYLASYKQGSNPDVIQKIEAGTASAEDYYNIYATSSVADDDENYDVVRKEEQKLLEADELRMHPKEAEITIMYEQQFVDEDADKKAKRLLKKQEKADKKAAQKAAEEAAKEGEGSEKPEQDDADPKKKGLLRGLFKKKENDSSNDVDETVNAEETEQAVEVETSEEVEKAAETETSEEVEKAAETETSEEVEKAAEAEASVEPEKVEEVKESEESEEKVDSEEDADMERRIDTSNIPNAVIIVDDDDDFEAEADTIEELINPEASKETAEETKEENKEETSVEETEPEKKKSAFVFQTVELAPEEFEDDSEVDDFSQTDDDGFGEMADFEEPEEEIVEETVEEPEEETVEETVETEKHAFVFQTVELDIEEEFDDSEVDDFSQTDDDGFGEMVDYEEAEEIVEESEEETVEETVVEPEEEIVEETIVEPEEEIVEETIEEPEEETVEETIEEPEEEAVEEAVEEPEEIVEEEEKSELVFNIVDFEEETSFEQNEKLTKAFEEFEEPKNEEEDLESALNSFRISDFEEVTEEPVVEEIVEESVVEEIVEESVVEEIAEDPVVEEIAEESVVEEIIEEPIVEEIAEEPVVEETVEIEVAPFTTKPEKKKLDFPVFRSSLFPNYHKEVKEVENNFDDIISEAQDKMSENMLKEEQMQREAEALLASLGIDVSDMKTSSSSFAPKVVQEPKGPSRDEIKSSLKIDNVKKDILKKLKENR